jgi:hypothetical protein
MIAILRFCYAPSRAITSGGAWTSSISTPSPDSGELASPRGWMKQTSCRSAPYADLERPPFHVAAHPTTEIPLP